MKVSIVGGTGFVGSYVVDRLVAAGHVPRLLVRPGSRDKVVQPGICEIVEGDLDSRDRLAELVTGADALIYLVGILREFPTRGITFEATQYRGFADSLEAARDAGIRRVVLMSANGVERGDLPYQRTKRRAEELLWGSGLDGTVFRPSVIFGDPRGRMEFCTQLKAQLVDPPLPAAVFFPGLALQRAGAQLMSPVHVADVARAFSDSLERVDTFGRTFPLGGPRTLSWKEIIATIARASGRRAKMMLPAPAWGVAAVARVMQGFDWFPLTADQVSMLMQGNAVNDFDAFRLLDIDPTGFDEEALDYLVH